jgi:prepilin-type processing-associated H-X9-DG protein
MLPQLEMQSVFNSFNFSLPPDTDPTTTAAAANVTGFTTFLSTLICPSDSAPVLVPIGNGEYATHNYNLNTGNGYSVVQYPVAPLTGAPNGVFFENSRISSAHFLDGMSQTAAISETIRSNPGDTFAQDPLSVFVITGDNHSTGPPIISDTDYASQCLTGSPVGFQATRGVRWHYGAPGHSMYNHRRPPNDKRYDCRGGLPHSNRSDPLWNQLSLNVAARSRHPGGVNTLFADGHVQFIKNTVNLQTWQALGSRNGGEVVSGDSF